MRTIFISICVFILGFLMGWKTRSAGVMIEPAEEYFIKEEVNEEKKVK